MSQPATFDFLAPALPDTYAARMGFPSKNHSPLIRRLTDTVARAVIRIGYRTLTLYWRKRGITRTGVGVIIRHDGEVLAVRHSYRPEYTIPGGGIGKNETPAIAAARELREELSLEVAPEDLVYLRQRRNTHLMVLYLSEAPDIRIDNREIIEAVFMTEEEAIRRGSYFRHIL